MAGTEEKEEPTAVQLRCIVSSPESGSPEFETQFCQELATSLTRGLGVTFDLAGDRHAGRAVTVDVRLSSANRADVTVAFGNLVGGEFEASSSITRSLTSFDRPLTPASARTLVRDIGLSMGLVR